MKQLFVRITTGRLNVFVVMDIRETYIGSKENFDFKKISRKLELTNEIKYSKRR